MLNKHYFVDDLHLSLWQEQEKSAKQVQERLMTEFVRKLLFHLVWKTLTQLAALVTDLHAKKRLGATEEMILWQRRRAV